MPTSTTEADDGESGEETDDEPSLDACTFAPQAVDWQLPDIVSGLDDPFELVSDSHPCQNGESLRYQVLDLTGDGAADFVVTDDCDASGVGSDRWSVHANTGEGFSQDAISWSLPPLFTGAADLFELTQDTVSCDGGQSFRFQLLDITGDGATDLVVTDGCDAQGIGSTHWDVFENTGDGFAQTPTTWTLPSFFSDNPDLFDEMQGSTSCGEGSFRFQVLDITGEGVVDLLVTDACDAAGIGTTQWQVFEGGEGGFADDPIDWTLPPLFAGNPDLFENTADSHACEASLSFRFQLLDIDGSGALDFLVTDACDTEGVGTDRWDVYTNLGDGFAQEPTPWALPPLIEGADPFDRVANALGCSGNEQFRFITTDLSGDGAPDLVVTDACDAQGVGTANWSVYENDGASGFVADATQWDLPQLLTGGTDLYEEIADAHPCRGDQQFRYQLLELSGDGAPDFVVTDECDPEGAGTTRWSSFVATCHRD